MTKVIAPRYRKARKKEKRTILDEYTKLTGYDRCYASYLLRSHGKKVRLRRDLIVVADVTQRLKRPRPKVYDEKVSRALKKMWRIMDWICGKRLAPMLPELSPILERFGEIKLERSIRAKLLRISAASIDRLLADEEKKQALTQRSRTKPGTLLKQQIPIRPFA